MKTVGIFSSSQGAAREHVMNYQHSLISWKPIFAGLFVTFLIHATLMALGVAIGGATVSEMLQNGGGPGRGLAAGAAIWIGVSALLSLAAGSYFAARTSTYITRRIGAAQGLTIAALFFSIMLYGAGYALGGLGNAIGMGAMNLATSPVVQNSVEDAISDLDLNSDTDVVVSGLMSRLLSGNVDSAKAYLASQTDLSEADLDQRFSQLQTDLQNSLRTASAQAASAAGKSAGSFFIILAVGIVMSILGGAAGAYSNYKKPLAEEAFEGNAQPIPIK
jgi:hypothetical protein